MAPKASPRRAAPTDSNAKPKFYLARHSSKQNYGPLRCLECGSLLSSLPLFFVWSLFRVRQGASKRAHSKEEPQESWKNPCQIAKDFRVISTGVTENAACGSLSSGFISSLNLFLKSLW